MEGVVLKRIRLSEKIRKAISAYYAKLGGMEGYADFLWSNWKKGKPLVYGIEKREKFSGFLVFDLEKSNIEEIYIDESPNQSEIVFCALDSILAKHSLVSATIHKMDLEKRRLLIDYGFRPFRYVKDGSYVREKLELSTVVYFDRLKEIKQIKPSKKVERVVIQRVNPAQSEEDIYEAVKELFEKLGGVRKYVKKGQTVVLKPNIVADHGMVNGIYKGGVVTDLRLVYALIRHLLPYASRIIVAEGSSINRSATTKMFKIYGYDRLEESFPGKVSLVDLNTDETVEMPVPYGRRMNSRKVPKTLLDADVIINLPVMKLHFAACVSLAIKNLQGTMPPIEKYMTHFFGLWQNLVNIHYLVRTKLTIVDGLVGQEDFGPVSGSPKVMNLLIGGENPVAIDATCMRIMGLEPFDSPPVLLAYIQGFGPVEQERIKVIGAKIEEVRSPFKMPKINLNSGRDLKIYEEGACPGCKGYLHFVLHKLRRPDPKEPGNLLIDRPLEKPVKIYVGPYAGREIDLNGVNLFMGTCQLHNAKNGIHLPGCPPHAEVIIKGIFQFFPDVLPPKYADDTEEAKLERMLAQILESL
ncbi:MAG: DUF362 domain-containing protein [Desulfobacterota bacterium]|nr:DUF362 domain-containing protein [Thermodesulfobacteriota bacterium]MDW8001655.1 DUF362 domain-containing protein [Deltaproteobacteria bacterium]